MPCATTKKMLADKTEGTMLSRPLSIYFHPQDELLCWNSLSNIFHAFEACFTLGNFHVFTYWISTIAPTNIPQSFHLSEGGNSSEEAGNSRAESWTLGLDPPELSLALV